MKFNVILHSTTSCNYNCSYCNVIKDNKNISNINLENILDFIRKNKNNINRFKFFGWEPLIAWKNIKYIIDNSRNEILNKYEIVTNTFFLDDEIWEYFKKYFEIIFFSIDTENYFDYKKISFFIQKFKLQNKVYFNLIINPWNEFESLKQFKKLYYLWLKWFNILPVYFTKSWSKKNLKYFSVIMKEILDLSIQDKALKLYWFMENMWERTSLINESLFIDTNGNIYYSDIVSTYFWKKLENKLKLWHISNFNLSFLENYDFTNHINIIKLLENKINFSILWQSELHKLMDYFSKYLINKNAK